jgi:putative ABC transport system substrate-binding protein
MRRRDFITLFGIAAAGWPLAARGQQPPLIAFLGASFKATAARYYNGFPQGMTELGYVEGRDYTFADRYANGDNARAHLQLSYYPQRC